MSKEARRYKALYFTWDEYRELLAEELYTKKTYNYHGERDSLDYRISAGYLSYCTAEDEKVALEKVFGVKILTMCTSSEGICFVIDESQQE